MRFPFRNIFKTDFIWISLLALIAGIIAGANYTPGTFLTGWDTLHPEFDFGLAFYRMLTGVWRADQGLGGIAIQSHIAELPRVALLWLASLLLPINTLRYVTFLCSLAVGSSGVYFLTRHMGKDNKHTNNFPSFFAGIAYLANLVTVQHFVVPLEMFAIQYALAPWFFYTAMRVLESGKRLWLLLFAIVTLLATPQAHTATLFYAYAALLILYLAAFVILHRSTGKRVLVRAIMILGITVSINAFWMLPNIYAVMYHGNDVRESAVNQLFSEEAYAKTEAFGTPINAMIGKNFLFDWQLVDPATGGQVDVLAPWINHLKRPMVLPYFYMLFALTVVGIITVVKKKNTRAAALLPVFIATFIVLLNGTWPISNLFTRIAGLSPILQEALRFSFTKFSILYILTLSVFIGYGLTSILGFIRVRVATISLSIFLFVYATYAFFPSLTGNLVSPAMRIAIPAQYFQMFEWFREKDWNSRIAILPIHSFWNWANYSWGYQGAGFLQFGIPQPILDRDYDRWSPYNENYYWEMSRAVYAKDAPAVERVLAKYDVRYILLDESIVSRENNRSVYTEELKGMLDIIWNIKEVTRFGKLTIYERLGDNNQSFISLKTNLPTVSPAYRWTDNDVAYGEAGDYSSFARGGLAKLTYPFRSLFTKRGVDEREFTTTETSDAITIGSLVEATAASILKADALVYDSTRSTDLVAQNVKPCGVLREGEATTQNVDLFLRFTSRNQRGCLSFGVGNFSHRDGYLVAVESRHISGRPLLFSLINQTAKHVELETYLEKETSYFILPPLASDGLGYTVYLSNDAIGKQETINDLKSIKFYRMPYAELVSMRIGNSQPQGRALSVEKVDHPNPSYYRITLNSIPQTLNSTLILSQSFDPGWTAWEKIPTFPYFRQLKDHVLVNNWSNGWNLQSDQFTNPTNEIVILFLPQLLQWLGFLLLPIPFLLAVFKKL